MLRGVHRVGVVVAVLLVAHLWMIHVAPPRPDILVTAQHDAASAPISPSAGGCPIGMVACEVVELDADTTHGLPSAVPILVGVVALVVLVRDRRHPLATRDDRSPSRPRAVSTVVLLQ